MRSGHPANRRPNRPAFSTKAQLAAIVILGGVVAGWFVIRAATLQPVPSDAPPVAVMDTTPAKPEAPAADAAPSKPTEAKWADPSSPADPAKPVAPLKPDPAPSKAPLVPIAPVPPGGRSPQEVAGDIDREVLKRLTAAKLAPAPLADDAEFLRRVYLDITGRVPTYEQAVRFLDSKEPDKRARLIDELLASSAYGGNFANYWIDLFVKRDPENNEKLPTKAFREWLGEKFNKNEGWDKVVNQLLVAKGKEAEVPETFFILANQDNNQPSADKIVGTAGLLFMGIQLQCSQCHVHPTVPQWNRQDFWGMAAFFGKTRADREAGAKGKGVPGTANITEEGTPPAGKTKKKDAPAKQPDGAVINIPNPNDTKKNDGTARAKFWESASPQLPGKAPYRAYAADWITSEKNKYFAPALVNRMWSYFFARGFVNPIDDMREDNEPSHPQLLRILAAEFQGAHYDLKHLIRCICNSQSYQRTSRPSSPNEPEEALPLFARMPVKVLSAEMLLDSVAVVSSHNAPSKDTAAAKGKNAAKSNPAGKPGSLAFFDTREYDDDPAEFTYGVPQILNLMNTYLGKTSAEVGQRIAGSSGGNKQKAIETLYLTVLARRPRDKETQLMLAYVGKQPDPVKGYAGVFWSLVNSAEFICNR